MKTYHIGLIKGSQGSWGNGHRVDTVIVQARKNKDELSLGLWEYYGEHLISKKKLHEIKDELLKTINAHYKTSFKHIVID